jgi:hypothetical protein
MSSASPVEHRVAVSDKSIGPLLVTAAIVGFLLAVALLVYVTTH